MLQPIPQWERQQAEVEAAEAAEAGQDQQLAGGRCLGAAMEAVLDYLGAQVRATVYAYPPPSLVTALFLCCEPPPRAARGDTSELGSDASRYRRDQSRVGCWLLMGHSQRRWCDVTGCAMLWMQGEPLSVLDNGFHAMGDGAAHDALLNANIHLLTFLAGIPNAGPGLLLPPEEQVCRPALSAPTLLAPAAIALKREPLAGGTASKTDVTIRSWLHDASSAAWSSTHRLHTAVSVWQTPPSPACSDVPTRHRYAGGRSPTHSWLKTHNGARTVLSAWPQTPHVTTPFSNQTRQEGLTGEGGQRVAYRSARRTRQGRD
jgi:hypothetical protein